MESEVHVRRQKGFTNRYDNYVGAGSQLGSAKFSDEVLLLWIDQFVHRIEDVLSFIAAPTLLQPAPQPRRRTDAGDDSLDSGCAPLFSGRPSTLAGVAEAGSRTRPLVAADIASLDRHSPAAGRGIRRWVR